MKLTQLSSLHRLSNLNLGSLATALSNKNGPKAKEIQSGMKQEVVDCLLKTKVFFNILHIFYHNFPPRYHLQHICFDFTLISKYVGNSCNRD